MQVQELYINIKYFKGGNEMFELMVNSRAKQLKKNEKGFTLVELIVVVAILGILAVIGITRFAGLTDSAREKADIATAASIATAAQTWIADQDHKVTTAPTLADLIGANLIEQPKNSRTNDGTWSIGYDASSNELTVNDGIQDWYPAP